MVVAAGLVHWFPLAGDLSDLANSSSSLIQQGSSGCVSYPRVAPSTASWTQSCGGGQSPATLSVVWPGESGDVTLSAYLYVSSYSQENTWLLSCNGFASGQVDCLSIHYDSVYGVLVAQLNANGNGNGMLLTLPAQRWFHLAASFTQSSGALTVYINAQPVMSFTAQHTTQTYGTPLIAGEAGDSSGYPSQASWRNLRQYTIALSQAQIATLTQTDYPS